MTIQDFLIKAKKLAENFYEEACEEVNVRTEDIVKANDKRLFGLSISREGSNVGVTIYLDDLYDMMNDGQSIERIEEYIVARCAYTMIGTAPELMEEIQDTGYYDFENVKNRLSVRLLDARLNRTYMKGRPYIDVGNGLALIAYINEKEQIYSEWKIAVTDNLLDEIGCGKEKILSEAMKNTIRIAPAMLFTITDALYVKEPHNYLSASADGEEGPCTVYTVTNEARFHGAAALYYPGVMKRISEVVGCSYYVIPSSIHEVIIVPEELGPVPGNLASALLTGNENVVEKEDILSEHVFYYDARDDEIRIAA